MNRIDERQEVNPPVSTGLRVFKSTLRGRDGAESRSGWRFFGFAPPTDEVKPDIEALWRFKMDVVVFLTMDIFIALGVTYRAMIV